jgi:uncharacterized protein YutE (UPF0331/DUF86 family)
MNDRLNSLLTFMDETIDYFFRKLEGVDRNLYFADRDIRNILDKTINDLILCMVDIAEECLRRRGRAVPNTYKDTLLACYEFLGGAATAVAPLVKHRNETIHLYLKTNWQNIVTVKNRIPQIRTFVQSVKGIFLSPSGN